MRFSNLLKKSGSTSEEAAHSQRLISTGQRNGELHKHTSDGNSRRDDAHDPELEDRKGSRANSGSGNDRLPWWPEFAAILGSLVLIAATVILLREIDGAPLEKWNIPWHIKPNTLVSILVTLCRLFLVLVLAEGISQLKWVYFQQRSHTLSDFQTFDTASRGALGSLRLLWSIRWHAVVASVGALLMVLVLAMDPLAQQLVSYELTNSTNLTATIGTARTWDMRTAIYASPQYQNNGDKLTDYSMVGAALTGLFGPGSAATFSCDSGNCTWPAFDSLAICSSCQDVSTSTVSRCHTPLDGFFDCEYTTPAGLSLSAYSQCLGAPTGVTNPQGALLRLNNTNNVTPLGSWENGTLLAIAAARFRTSYLRSDEVCPLPEPTIWDCSLSWCAQTYGASASVNGRLSDNPTEVNPLLWLTSLNTSSCPGVTSVWNGVTGGAWDSDGVIVIPAVSLQDQSASDWLSIIRCPSDIPPDLAFWINLENSLEIDNSINEIFNGSLTLGMDPYQTGGATSQAILQAIYDNNGGDFPKTLAAMATAMTTQIRQGPNTTIVQGDTTYAFTYIHINWPWLVYPVTLVLLAFAFLLATVFFSSERSKIVWKSSSLAVLFLGSKVYEQYEFRERTPHDMVVAAQDIRVRFLVDDHDDLKVAGD